VTDSIGAGSETVKLAFATPMVQRLHPSARDIAGGLARAVLDREAREPGLRVSNVGGWHSKPDLFEWPEPEVAVLKRWIREALVPLLDRRAGVPPGGEDVAIMAEGWAMVYRNGDWGRRHAHPANHWSGIYCVSPGVEESAARGGDVVFTDPRPGAEALPIPGLALGQDVSVRMQPGLTIIFPSWLSHSVTPYRGREPRITIAFNITVSPRSTAS
jgi:uncharacterized protein (TIGR02466 family)